MILPCLVCGATLVHAFDQEHRTPAGAVVFRAVGNYGSGVWDPIGRSSEFLEVNICDDCLLMHVARVSLGRGHQRPMEFDYQTWDPEDNP